MGGVAAHRRALVALVMAGALVLASCGDGGLSVGRRPASGARGDVSARPSCPVERQDRDCPPSPVVAPVVARTDDGKEVARAESDGGHYRLVLLPGTYRVTAETGDRPRCPPVDVTVGPGRFTTADIVCDTGIR